MAHQSTDGKAHVTSFSPEPEKVEKKEEEDDDFPQSLEEALLGE